MRVIHQSRLKHLKLTFATGDIFDAPVEAIVNSEQTDFKLSRNRNSLSGQIWFRYGEILQRELDLVTEGQILGPGTVIKTTGGQDFKHIFHAGFHYPSGWPNLPRLLAPVEQGDTRQTEYFEAIGSCVTQILNIAEGVKVKSIAFPLIGCGIFGLDEKMLILQFLDSLEEAGARLADAELNVWLVIRDPDQFESAAGAFLDLLLRSRHEMVQIQLESTGVTLLDRFAARISAPTHKDWAKWQLCRYAEVAVQFMYYGINRGIHPPISPLSVFKPNHPWTFGHVLDKATTLALSKRSAKKSWGAFFFAGVLEEPKSAYALDQLRSQRNNLAHGRQTLEVIRFQELLIHGLQLNRWQQIVDTDGQLDLSSWEPWIAQSPKGDGQIGLFERWQKGSMSYLVPETGAMFESKIIESSPAEEVTR